jgi:hypothetical protein
VAVSFVFPSAGVLMPLLFVLCCAVLCTTTVFYALLLRCATCSYKIWASNRFLFFWGEFIRHPDAKRDPQYTPIQAPDEAATPPRPAPAPGAPAGAKAASSGADGAKRRSKAKAAPQ